METDAPLAPPVVAVVVVHRPGSLVRRDARLARRPGLPEPQHAVPARRRPRRRRRRRPRRADHRAPARRLRPRPLGANPGFGVAANEVLALVEGDNGFFCICHDDVALDPDAIRGLVEELYRSNAGLVGPKLVSWDDPAVLQHVGLGLDRFGEVDPITEPGEYDQEQHDAVRDVFVLPSACVLVRADLFRALGGFDAGDLLPRRRRRPVLAGPPQRRPCRRRPAGPGPPPRGARGAAARPQPRHAAGPPPDALGRHADQRRAPAAALARARRADRRPSCSSGSSRPASARRGRRCGRSSGWCPGPRRLLARRARGRPSCGASTTPRSCGCRTAAAPALTALPAGPRHRDVHRHRGHRPALAGEPAEHDDRLGRSSSCSSSWPAARCSTRKVPTVGEFLPLPASPRDWWSDFTSAWNPGGLGADGRQPDRVGRAVDRQRAVAVPQGLGLTVLVVGLRAARRLGRVAAGHRVPVQPGPHRRPRRLRRAAAGARRDVDRPPHARSSPTPPCRGSCTCCGSPSASAPPTRRRPPPTSSTACSPLGRASASGARRCWPSPPRSPSPWRRPCCRCSSSSRSCSA